MRFWHAYHRLLPNSIVDNLMVRRHLLLHRIIEILHACCILLQVHIAQSAIEKDFARVQPKFKAQLFIVNVGISSQVEQGVVEIGQSFLKVANEEVRYSLLEVCDS
jgi:hypothetical protein